MFLCSTVKWSELFTQAWNCPSRFKSEFMNLLAYHSNLCQPENILMENKESNNIKITDFGLARIVGEREMMTTLCGTPQYVAPEIIMQSTWTPEQCKEKGGYGKEVDMWSLGAIFYVL